MDHQQTFHQIGPLTFLACGARNFVNGPNLLQFTVGSNPRLLEKMVITLSGDTYTVRYVVIRRKDLSTVLEEVEEGIYDIMLRRTVLNMGDRAWTEDRLQAAAAAQCSAAAP